MAMDETTIQAAIHAVNLDIPEFIRLDSKKHRSDQDAANNLRWIVGTLIDCFDNKKSPPAKLLYSLRGLSDVADLMEQIAALPMDKQDDQIFENHKKKRKEAQNVLLDIFGLYRNPGAPGYDESEQVLEMAKLLCPPLNDEYEQIGEAQYSSVQAAAKSLEAETGVSYKTYIRAWKSYEKLYSE